jgi:hypothetical protein
MTIEKDIQRGLRAKQILEDDLMVEATAHIDSELWRVFKEAKPNDAEALMHIRQMQYMHTKYQEFLRACVANGKLAQINLEAKKKSLKDRIFG